MKVYRGLKDFKIPTNSVVTTGTFDGVHKGHKTIVNRLKKIANEAKGETVLITFHPHPRIVLQKNPDLKLLSTIDERIALIEATGIDHLVIIPFDKKFAALSSLEFVQHILVEKIGTKKLVIGYDHHFGKNREGSFDHLKTYGPQYGFEVEEIPAQEINDVNISSTKIRAALEQGELIKANDFLGHPYLISGKVVKGEQLGRSIGFPTANIEVESKYKLIPKQGVYAVQLMIDGQNYNGMLNIGVRPTVNDKNKQTIEVNIFNFKGDLYDKTLIIELMQRVRDEKQFNGVNELKLQLEQDLKYCNEILTAL